MSNTPTTKYLSLKEAATILCISANTLNRLVQAKKLDAFRFGNQIRIPEDSLKQYIESNKI